MNDVKINEKDWAIMLFMSMPLKLLLNLYNLVLIKMVFLMKENNVLKTIDCYFTFNGHTGMILGIERDSRNYLNTMVE